MNYLWDELNTNSKVIGIKKIRLTSKNRMKNAELINHSIEHTLTWSHKGRHLLLVFKRSKL